NFARDARHFPGERVQLIDHGVHGLFQFEDFARDVDGDLLGQVTAGDGGGDFGDVAHLACEVGGHEVHVVGEIFPGACDAGHRGLAAELAFSADFARDTRHFGCEGVQLVDHRVDGVFELQHFAAHVDGDLARKVAARHGSGHLRDVAHLVGEVAAH